MNYIGIPAHFSLCISIHLMANKEQLEIKVWALHISHTYYIFIVEWPWISNAVLQPSVERPCHVKSSSIDIFKCNNFFNYQPNRLYCDQKRPLLCHPQIGLEIKSWFLFFFITFVPHFRQTSVYCESVLSYSDQLIFQIRSKLFV